MRVIVTRPLPQGEQTAAKLAALGHQPALLPLTEIHPIDPGSLPDNLAAIAMVVATSANALIHAPQSLMQVLRDIPFLGVGAATEHAALVCGFSDTDNVSGDASGLAAHVITELPKGAHIAYLCGRVRKPDLEQTLGAAGIHTVPLETYDTASVSYSTECFHEHFVAGTAQAVLLYSRNSARRIADLLGSAGPGNPIDSVTFFCLSADVAAPLKEAGFPSIVIAAEPNENALLNVLETMR